MRFLLAGFQIILVYLLVAISVGMLRSPNFNALELVIVGAFFVGNLLVTVFVPRFTRGAQLSPVRSKRIIAALSLSLLGLGSWFIAYGVLVGSWRGPSRLAAIHQLSVQFAGVWAFSLAFFMLGSLCLTFAFKVLRSAEA